MAAKLVPGIGTYLEDFATGQGGGGTNYFAYASDFDINFLAIRNATNALIDEMRGVQGTNSVIPLDLVLLDDPLGVGVTTNVLIGVNSYLATFITTTQVDVKLGVCVLSSIRQSASNGVSLGPVVGTDDGGTDFAYIALDINGTITINTAPNSKVLDVWRVEVNAGGTQFVDNIQKVGIWQYAMDGDAWVEMSDASALGGTDTFATTFFDQPKHRMNRVERLMGGWNTDLQSPAVTIGPIVVPGGSAATPGLVVGDGTGTNELDTGFYRLGVDRIGMSSGGNEVFEGDAQGNIDLTSNARVKGNRTAAQAIADATATLIDFNVADDFDQGGGSDTWHDHASGTLSDREEFTCPTGCDGLYMIVFEWVWDVPVTNERTLTMEVTVNGTAQATTEVRAMIDQTALSGTTTAVLDLSATDIVRGQVTNDDFVGALGLNLDGAKLSIVKIA